jgi:signal transduction histidine kinase
VLEIHNDDARLQCTVNKSQITRVFDNLIINAIKFTHAGGIVLVTLTKKGTHVVIEVKDNGIGIPENLKDGIFKPFTSSGRQGTSQEQSTGLGLSIVKDIVEKYSGEIWFESVEGKGTSFFVKLPLE